ncbi:MAG TPA: hypothetical protein VIK50_08910 [Gemmatimonadaceae bacterium]
MMRSFIRVIPLAALLACQLGTAPEAPEGSVKVLFIGNSLTYENDLPRTVSQLALSAGLAPCYCVAIAYPDFALEDHWDFGDAVTALEDEEWDFVVMQQGPSALASSRANLVLWAGVFGDLIDQNGAQSVMYGVWPQLDRAFDFPNVTASYREAADSIGALFAPAGEAWQLAWAQDSTLPLYAADDFHPSPMGTYLAALVVFQRIYGRSPVGVQQSAVVNGQVQLWPVPMVSLLQEAAAAANAAEDARIVAPREALPAIVRGRQ